MFGFCSVEEKLFGPDHEYVAPITVVAFKLSVCPEQTGVLLPAEGEDGALFTMTVVVPIGPVHPFTVAVTEYVPALEEVTPLIVGFCVASVNVFGPLHA